MFTKVCHEVSCLVGGLEGFMRRGCGYEKG